MNRIKTNMEMEYNRSSSRSQSSSSGSSISDGGGDDVLHHWNRAFLVKATRSMSESIQ